MKKYKGTRDLLAEEYGELKKVFSKIRGILENYSYGEYKAPTIEFRELYEKKTSEELLKEQSFGFNKNGKELMIRPELTPSLTRMILNKGKDYRLPLRLYSIDTMMRYENPQKGRLREFFQINFDNFYNNRNLALIEVLSLMDEIFDTLELKNEKIIYLNNKEWFSILNKKFSWGDESILLNLIDKSFKEDISDKLAGFDNKETLLEYLSLDSWESFIEFLEAYNLKELSQEIIAWKTRVKGLAQYNSKIVRGLNYYTGFVFEVYASDSSLKRALGGGGEYDLGTLLEGKELPAIGVGLGEVPIMELLKEKNKKFSDPSIDEVLVTYQDVESEFLSSEVQTLLSKNNKVFLLDKKVKMSKVFNWINSYKPYKYVVFLGKAELEGGFISIKNTETREQIQVSIENLRDLKLDF